MSTNIGSDYAEVDQRELNEVNYDAADIAEDLGIAERAEVFQKRAAFVNSKDIKPYQTSKILKINPPLDSTTYDLIAIA